MRTRTPAALAAACLTPVALALLLTGCAATPQSPAGGSAATAATTSEPSAGAPADVAFAQFMIPHHEQAIEMAELATANAGSQQVKDLAAQIAAAQGPEIKTMTGWLQAWGAPTVMPSPSGTGSTAMDDMGHDMGGMTAAGMMSAADMAALAQARGTDFDRMWLTMMIAHHEGAIAMAQQVTATASDPQVQAMAADIITGQTAEIDTMEELLAPA